MYIITGDKFSDKILRVYFKFFIHIFIHKRVHWVCELYQVTLSFLFLWQQIANKFSESDPINHVAYHKLHHLLLYILSPLTIRVTNVTTDWPLVVTGDWHLCYLCPVSVSPALPSSYLRPLTHFLCFSPCLTSLATISKTLGALSLATSETCSPLIGPARVPVVVSIRSPILLLQVWPPGGSETSVSFRVLCGEAPGVNTK